MSYRVIKKEEDFGVLEIDTDQIVYQTDKEESARTICRDLNLGKGFLGFTPRFFCDNFIVREKDASNS